MWSSVHESSFNECARRSPALIRVPTCSRADRGVRRLVATKDARALSGTPPFVLSLQEHRQNAGTSINGKRPGTRLVSTSPGAAVAGRHIDRRRRPTGGAVGTAGGLKVTAAAERMPPSPPGRHLAAAAGTSPGRTTWY